MRRIAIPLAAAALLAAQAAGASAPDLPETFADAKALAAESGKPVLVDFFTTWCGPCKAFAKATQSDAEIQAALDNVVLFETDAEHDGLDLATEHHVESYPTFILMNADGETLGRWSGYEKGFFLETSSGALADLTTIEQKTARFDASPNVADAEKLARYHESRGDHRDAVTLFTKAQELDGKSRAIDIFVSTAYGVDKDVFTMDDARKAADAVVAVKGQDPESVIETYSLMQWLEGRKHVDGVATPYLEPAFAATEGRPELAGARAQLEIDRALRIEKDGDKAFDLKLASMKDGWKESAAGLNSMAWWCFENNVKLDEAETMAKRGVELAEDDGTKANILDTLAEICNARGNCPEAVVYERQATELSPQREYFRKQLERFEALAAANAN